MSRWLVLAVALAACGKKSKPASHADAAVAATHAPEAPALPSDAAVEPVDAPIATHVTPLPPPSTKFGHFCVKLPTARCAITESECKRFGSRCGEFKSVFCFMEASGAQCFPSSEDCKTAHDIAVHRSEQVTGDCVQDEM